MLYVMGVDPGLTTGWCALGVELTVKGGKISCYESLELSFQEIGDLLTKAKTTYPWSGGEVVVVNEKFTITQATAKNSQAPWSLEVTGLVKYFALTVGVPYLSYKPSDSMSLITDVVLKKAGIYDKGSTHKRDAARQALYYVITQRGLLTEFLP